MSPIALLRSCPADGCPELMAGGPCPFHARERERARGTATQRGYDARWRGLVARFKNALIKYDIAPVCGARLPGAPVTNHSRCAAEGVLNDRQLETDHIVPHRGDRHLFKDLNNFQLLCHTDHSRKTASEDGAFGR